MRVFINATIPNILFLLFSETKFYNDIKYHKTDPGVIFTKCNAQVQIHMFHTIKQCD